VKRVLFICVENAGRSQMAQALYEARGGEARSAGSAPAEQVHQAVVEAMDEVGIDLSNRRPKGLSQEDVAWADLVVTMGCGDACPVLPGKEYEDWNLPDPAGACLEEVRELRGTIAKLVGELVEPLSPHGAARCFSGPPRTAR
jgi:arsenate reductase